MSASRIRGITDEGPVNKSDVGQSIDATDLRYSRPFIGCCHRVPRCPITVQQTFHYDVIRNWCNFGGKVWGTPMGDCRQSVSVVSAYDSHD